MRPCSNTLDLCATYDLSTITYLFLLDMQMYLYVCSRMHVHVFVPSYVILCFFFPTCNVVPLICVLGASEYYYVVLVLPTYFLSTIPHYELLWIFFCHGSS